MNDMKNSWDNRRDTDAAKPADTIKNGVENAADKAGDLARKAGEGIKQGAEKAADKLGQAVDKTADRLQGKKDY